MAKKKQSPKRKPREPIDFSACEPGRQYRVHFQNGLSIEAEGHVLRQGHAHFVASDVVSVELIPRTGE